MEQIDEQPEVAELLTRVGSNIRRRRMAAQMTIRSLFELTGLDTGSISRIERGAFMPAAERLVAIAKALNCRVEDLFAESEDDAPSLKPPMLLASGHLLFDDSEYWPVCRVDIKFEGGVAAIKPTTRHVLIRAMPEGSARSLISLTAVDDTMAPAIRGGVELIIDTAQTAIQSGRIYLIAIGGEWSIRRLLRTPLGGVRAVADSSDIHNFELDPASLSRLEVLGRVVQSTGTL